jgi:hypothetical protein
VTSDEPTLRIGGPPTARPGGTTITVVQAPPGRKRPGPWLIALAVGLIASGVTVVVLKTSEPTPEEALKDAVKGITVSLEPNDLAYTGPLPTCAETFVPGQVFAGPAEGNSFVCTDPDGTKIISGGHRCNDGRHLWSTDRSNTGTTAGFGFGGEPWHAIKGDDIGGDPGFGKAYSACFNIRD